MAQSKYTVIILRVEWVVLLYPFELRMWVYFNVLASQFGILEISSTF